MAVGKEIKRLRENQDRKLSVAKVASLIGVDPERLRKWEQRDADPTDIEDAHKIEQYFGVAMGELKRLDSFQFKAKNSSLPDMVAYDPETNNLLIIELKNDKKILQDQLIRANQFNDLLKEKLSRVESNLNLILSNQAGIVTLLKEGITRAAKYRYGLDQKGLEKELAEINKIVGGVLK